MQDDAAAKVEAALMGNRSQASEQSFHRGVQSSRDHLQGDYSDFTLA
jgi:hypothetical protein